MAGGEEEVAIADADASVERELCRDVNASCISVQIYFGRGFLGLSVIRIHKTLKYESSCCRIYQKSSNVVVDETPKQLAVRCNRSYISRT